MRRIPRIWLILMVLPVASRLSAQISFGGLTMSSEEELLYTATVDVPEFGGHATLFRANLDTDVHEQLTVFPEHLVILPDTETIQIQSRFGVFRGTPDSAGRLTPVADFPSFAESGEATIGKLNAAVASPDGRFLVYSRPVSPAFADVILYDLRNDREIVLAEAVAYSTTPPVRWAPSSRFLVYARGGELFYFSVEQYDRGRMIGESFRSLGDGVIESVRWGATDQLYLVRGTLIHELLSAEFFTRSLYRDLLQVGRIVGKLPFAFDPNFDSYWIAPNGRQVLFNKGGRNIFLYVLQAEDFSTTGDPLQLPYLLLPRNTRVERVLWSEADTITLVTGSIRDGAPQTSVFRISRDGTESEYVMAKTPDEGVSDVVLSYDGSLAAVLLSDRVEVRSYRTWSTLRTIPHTDPVAAAWLRDGRLVVAGRDVTTIYAAEEGEPPHVVALSRVDDVSWDSDDRVRVRVGSEGYVLTESGWEDDEVTSPLSEPRVAGANYRVYLESTASGPFTNTVMIRQVQDLGTRRLFDRPERAYEPFPTADEPVDLTYFTHGSRIRRRQVAFVFDAVDSVAGLTDILATLNDYEIRATFFVNGDFVRRHPDAVAEIARSGHEVGSLFYTYFDMADAAFQIGSDFIRQGLARNEDEYFQATGRELALLWHTPFYFVSPTILEAGRSMNYTFVGRDVDALDWVPRLTESGTSPLYRTSPELVERILEEKRPGSVISMRIGRPGDDQPSAARDDYLFQYLDALIEGLHDQGYEIVPVSTLMEAVR